MAEQMKPCPFCGAPGNHGKGFAPLESIDYAYCSNPECVLHFLDHHLMDVAQWNTRVQPAAVDVPAGWKLVPVEPTEAMLNAFNEMAQCEGYIPEGYARMLAAAPSPSAGE